MATRLAAHQHRLRRLPLAGRHRRRGFVPPTVAEPTEQQRRDTIEDACRRSILGDTKAGAGILFQLGMWRRGWTVEQCADALWYVEDAIRDADKLTNGWLAVEDVCGPGGHTREDAEEILAGKLDASIRYCLFGSPR
jgi:hypothetical protein